MPEVFKGHTFLTLEYWQWVGLLTAIFLAVMADFLSRHLLATTVRRLAHRHLGDADDASVRYTVRPMSLVIGALVFLLLISLLGLPKPASTILFVAGRVLLIVGIAWAAWSLTDLISNILLTRAKATATTFDDMFIPLLRKTIKLFLMALAAIYVADTFNIALAPLLGGLGLAGLAVSFAAQDLVKNLFGGIMIFLDRPFKIGERIKFQDYDGMIEEIGFRTTRLRTLTGHLVTIPNGSITNEAVENIGRRPFIRRAFHVTITYDTPRPKIEEAVTIIRSILEEEGIREPIHPVISGDEYPPRVYFSDYGSTSLDITVLYWYAPPAYWDYLEHGQRFNLRLFEAFAQAGIEFAFPTQTVFLAGDPQRELAVRTAAEEGAR
jgi:MscS family membrane protein